MNTCKNTFFTFCQTITKLRSENGCLWDRKQTVKTLGKYISEECDELLEAIEEGDPAHMCEEIGDVLFLLVLLSEINSELKNFTIEDVLSKINEKMIRRHPHVFDGAVVNDEEELTRLWKKIKSAEKEKKIN